MSFFEGKYDITQGFEKRVFKALYSSIEKNNNDMYSVILKFIRRVLSQSIDFASKEQVNKFVYYLPRSYQIAYFFFKENPTYKRIYITCSENAAIHLKELIQNTKFSVDLRTQSDETIESYNNLHYIFLNALSQLLCFQLNNKDLERFQNAANELSLLLDKSGEIFSMESQIKFNENIDNPNLNNEQLQNLKRTVEFEKKFEDQKRHSKIGIRNWILFLFQVKKLNVEEAKAFLKEIKVNYFDPKWALEDILFFRESGSRNYFEWDNWDYKERKSGQTYSPPDPRLWHTLGYLVSLIQGKITLGNLEEVPLNELKRLKYLGQDLNNFIDFISKDLDRWLELLAISEKDLTQKLNQIKVLIEDFELKEIDAADRAIATTPISLAKVEEFKNIIGDSWRDHRNVSNLFEIFGNREDITGQEEKLKDFGSRLFIEKGKQMFIDGENYQWIYGFDTYGGNVGRLEDDAFFSLILKNEKRTETFPLLETLEKAFEELQTKSQENNPDLIISSSEIFYQRRDLIEHPDYNEKQPIEGPLGESKFYVGTFKGIPILFSHSSVFQSKVMVCDFRKSFRMKYKTNQAWIDNLLRVEVQEISNNEAETKYELNPEKWRYTQTGPQLSKESALIRIKSSINIEISSILDFFVLDKSGFVIREFSK